jgi:hypothetical protein
MPADDTSSLLECHGPSGEVPNDGPQCGHPYRTEDHIEPGERHDKEVDAKLPAVDGDWGLAEDTWP